MFLAPWADRDPRLKELDQAMAAAVAAQATADVRSALAAAANTIGQVIRLAESWRMQGGLLDVEHVARVLLETCRPWMGEGRRSDEGEAASPVAADLAAPEVAGQLPLPEST